jgi:hypothetical protein
MSSLAVIDFHDGFRGARNTTRESMRVAKMPARLRRRSGKT